MSFKKIAVASDHAGFKLKEIVIDFLKSKNYEVNDFGTNNLDSVDYPDYGAYVAKSVLAKESDAGVLICGTGLGISIAANRFNGIRAALCHDSFTAKMSRRHNDANIIAFGANVIASELAKDMLDTWLNTEFEGGRHERRINKIDTLNIEKSK